MTTSRATPPTGKFLCVEEDVKRCASQCWQCQNIEEFEACGEPPEDDDDGDTGEDVEDSDAR